jgi:hypothetical protein
LNGIRPTAESLELTSSSLLQTGNRKVVNVESMEHHLLTSEGATLRMPSRKPSTLIHPDQIEDALGQINASDLSLHKDLP